jgi:hypothetical protein
MDLIYLLILYYQRHLMRSFPFRALHDTEDVSDSTVRKQRNPEKQFGDVLSQY